MADQVKDGQPSRADYNGFAVDQTRPDSEVINGIGDPRKARCKVIAVACEQPDAALITACQDAEATMLDLMHPVGTARRVLSRTRQTRRHKTRLRTRRVTRHTIVSVIG